MAFQDKVKGGIRAGDGSMTGMNVVIATLNHCQRIRLSQEYRQKN